MKRLNQRTVISRPEGGFALRIYRRKANRRKMPRHLIKCGCCEQKVEIYHDADFLEINGVIGSLENWREVLMPLLGLDATAKAKQKSLTP